jgi:excisionase family DNA binding protein
MPSLCSLVAGPTPASSTAKREPVQPNGGKRWQTPVMAGPDRQRFLTLADVAEILNTSVAQVRALVLSGELRSIQIGGRKQYRVEDVELEDYIRRMYDESDARSGRTRDDVDKH